MEINIEALIVEAMELAKKLEEDTPSLLKTSKFETLRDSVLEFSLRLTVLSSNKELGSKPWDLDTRDEWHFNDRMRFFLERDFRTKDMLQREFDLLTRDVAEFLMTIALVKEFPRNRFFPEDEL